MIDHLIETVRAGLAPGADAAARERAAGVLRGVLVLLQPAGATSVPSSSAAGAVAAEVMDVADPKPASVPDLLGALIERLSVHVPEQVRSDMPRFSVPLIRVPR